MRKRLDLRKAFNQDAPSRIFTLRVASAELQVARCVCNLLNYLTAQGCLELLHLSVCNELGTVTAHLSSESFVPMIIKTRLESVFQDSDVSIWSYGPRTVLSA